MFLNLGIFTIIKVSGEVMEEKKEERFEADLNRVSEIVTDMMIRITALEAVLIKNNVVSESEYFAELSSLRDYMIKSLKQEAERLVKEVS